MQEIIQSSAIKRERAEAPSLTDLNERIAKAEREMTSFRPAVIRRRALARLKQLESFREGLYHIPAPRRGGQPWAATRLLAR